MVNPGSPPPGPGSTFGPYRIDSVIGVGGMGVVYMATDQRLGRPVALKVVIGHLAQSPEFLERFQREAAALARLQSPHVVQIFDHGVEGGTPFIATQYAAGGDLGKLLAQRGPMPPALAAELCAQVADALRDAHRVGVVHRDVKPANVLLRDDRLDRVHVLLCDFGVAQTDASPLTQPGSVPGTWSYLAPERIAGEPGSALSDVYAVGCLLWETITGRPPYAGSDVEVAMAHQQAPLPQLAGTDAFTQHANRILAGTLSKEPSQRYQSASVLRDDLRSLAGIPSHPPQPAPPPVPPVPVQSGGLTPTQPDPVHSDVTRAGGPPVPPPPYPYASPPHGSASGPDPRRRNRLVIAAVAAVVVLAIVIGAVAAVVSGDDDPATVDPGPTDPTSQSSDPSDPSDPTESSEPTEPTEPDTSGPIAGDVDGDGYGDVALLTLQGMSVLRSDGSSLAAPELRKQPKTLVGVSGDVDGDGELDVVRLQNDPPRMAASMSAPGSPTSPIQTPESPVVTSSLDVSVALGDVDGDDALDLVLMTPTSETDSQIDVALGDGNGAFAATTTWHAGPLPEGTLVVADADGDGIDDAVHVSRSSDDPGPQATLLRSDGSAFAVTGDPTTVDAGGFAVKNVLAADVDGDGAEELVGITGYGPKINVWSWNGTTFDQDPWFDESDTLDSPTISGVSVSDLNGDGYDDLYLVTIDDNLEEQIGGAYLSDGTAFSADPSWTGQLGVDELRYSSYSLLSRTRSSAFG